MIKLVLVTPESKLPVIALQVWLFFPPKNKHNICAHIYADITKKIPVFLWLVAYSWYSFLLSIHPLPSRLHFDHTQGLDRSMRLTIQENCSQHKYRGRMSTWGKMFKETWFTQEEEGGKIFRKWQMKSKEKNKSVFLHRPLNLPGFQIYTEPNFAQ